jgi:hypothetical protein
MSDSGSGSPVVHLYAVCWNEAHLLPFFFRNYEPWVQRFIIFDNGSTDGTQALLAAKPNVELRQFPWSDPGSFVRSHQNLHNSCWRESRGIADWVVVTAIDEHLHHPDMREFLRRCEQDGVTCVPALGHEMVTKEFPDSSAYLAEVHPYGVPKLAFNKLRLFKPDRVEPSFAIGGHRARLTGEVIYPPRDDLLLLHYKHLGLEYVAERNRLLDTGLRTGDRAQGWGWHYRKDRAGLEKTFERLTRNAVDIRGPHYVAWRDHPHPRFWRSTGNSPAAAKHGWRLRSLWQWLKGTLRHGR